MQPEDVGRSYDEIAHRWQDPVLQSNGIAQHERALRFLAPASDNKPRRALDVGCGSSGRFIDLLLRARSFGEIDAVDISTRMIDLARDRHPSGVRFHHADIRTWAPPAMYDFITAWDSIWHVPLPDQPAVLRKLCDHLTLAGVLLFTLGGTDHPSEKHDAHMGPPMYHATLGLPATLTLLTSAHCTCRHLEYDQHPELHVYIIAQKIR